MDHLALSHREARPVFSARAIARGYLECFRRILATADMEAVVRVVEVLREARDRGAAIYLAGNGGSAATATHLANDLGKATKRSGRRPIRVLCLSDNVSWLTALGNDEGYARVFTGQLENFAEPGDVLVVISCSGNSPNLVDAVDFARGRGLTTVGVLGFDGGVLKDRVDECLWLESEKGLYGPVESGHAVLCDLLTTCLIEDRAAGGESDGGATDGAPERAGPVRRRGAPSARGRRVAERRAEG